MVVMVSVACQLDSILGAMNIWACLLWLILTTLIEAGRPAHCGCHHSLVGILGCLSGERG